MNRKLLVLSILPALALLGTIQDTQTSARANAVVTTPSAQGLVLNIDANTGVIVDRAAPGATKLAIPAGLASNLSTTDEGLMEQPNPSGGKGTYVNLQGRYQNAMVSTATDGKLVTPCAQGLNTAANTASHK